MNHLTKNKKGAIVGDTISGIGGIVILVIIVLVITSTLLGANLFANTTRSTTAFIQDTSSAVSDETAVAIPNSTLLDSTCTVVEARNKTNDVFIDPGNYTVSDCTILFSSDSSTDAGWFNNTVWTVNTTTIYAGIEKSTSNDLQGNFTEGVDNVSSKIPTILLIVAVVFLFGALVLLVNQSRKMGIGGGGTL